MNWGWAALVKSNKRGVSIRRLGYGSNKHPIMLHIRRTKIVKSKKKMKMVKLKKPIEELVKNLKPFIYVDDNFRVQESVKGRLFSESKSSFGLIKRTVKPLPIFKY